MPSGLASLRLIRSKLRTLILAQITGEESRVVPDVKDPAAVALGRKGGLKGGKARGADALTPGAAQGERQESRRGQVGQEALEEASEAVTLS